MKIAHIVDSMEVGGAETLVSQLCQIQREQGHEPRVFAIKALGALGERMRADGFAVDANIGRHLVDSSLHFFRLFKQWQPDVVHLHNPTPTIYAAPAARLARTASIISTRHSLVAPPRNLKMERKYTVAARFCDWVVGICDATTANVKDARSAPLHKIVRVYNGALPLTKSSRADLVKTGFTLLYTGRLEPVKNHALLLEGFRAALQEIPSLQLWMVGDGSERKHLEEISRAMGIQQNVTFWGQQLDVAPFFSSADAFVMSSVSEGLPMSLLQALSAGLPAIVTDVGGMSEVVRLADAGMTVPIGDPSAMAAAMLHLARNSADRKLLSERAEIAFRTHFTLDAMARSYMELYEATPRARARAAARFTDLR